MGMTEVKALLTRLFDAELAARRAHHVEPDDKKYIKLTRAYDALLGEGGWSGLSRPSGKPASHYKTREAKSSAAELRAPTLFALARYEHKVPLYRAWLGSTRLGPRGEGLNTNLWIEDRAAGAVVVAHYTSCSTCWARATVKNFGRCPDCFDGWQHRGGTRFKKLAKLRAIEIFAEPSDALVKDAFARVKALKPEPEPEGKRAKARTAPKASKLAGKAKKIDRTPAALQLCLSGSPLPDVVTALARLPLFSKPPTHFEDDAGEKVKVPAQWVKALAAGNKKGELTANWGEDSKKYLVVDVSRQRVSVTADGAITSADQLAKLLESLPFTLCTLGGDRKIGLKLPVGFVGHPRLRWGCAFRGEGHDLLVSRRWLEFGPWQLVKRPGDLSVVFFHQLGADLPSALAQALPGHEAMISERGGYLGRDEDDAVPPLPGTYDRKKKTLEVRAAAGSSVSETEMTAACLHRARRRGAKDAIERIAWIFADASDAEAHLHQLWLRECEVWHANKRLDEGYAPKVSPPPWA